MIKLLVILFFIKLSILLYSILFYSFNFTLLKFQKDSTTGVSYLGKFLKIDNFSQLFRNSLGRLLLTYCNFSSQQFPSAVIFSNVTLNVNKIILQIALLECTPYKTNMPVSFTEDYAQIIVNDSGFYSRLTAQIVYYKISCTRKTY